MREIKGFFSIPASSSCVFPHTQRETRWKKEAKESFVG